MLAACGDYQAETATKTTAVSEKNNGSIFMTPHEGIYDNFYPSSNSKNTNIANPQDYRYILLSAINTVDGKISLSLGLSAIMITKLNQ